MAKPQPSLLQAREALLELVAEAQQFELIADADTNSSGRLIDKSRIKIECDVRMFEYLIEMLGFNYNTGISGPVDDFLVTEIVKGGYAP